MSTETKKPTQDPAESEQSAPHSTSKVSSQSKDTSLETEKNSSNKPGDVKDASVGKPAVETKAATQNPPEVVQATAEVQTEQKPSQESKPSESAVHPPKEETEKKEEKPIESEIKKEDSATAPDLDNGQVNDSQKPKIEEKDLTDLAKQINRQFVLEDKYALKLSVSKKIFITLVLTISLLVVSVGFLLLTS